MRLGSAIGAAAGAGLAVWNAVVNAGQREPLGDASCRALGACYPGLDLGRVRLRRRAWLPIAPGYVAVTLGHTIYFRGAPDLASPAGRRLLTHELEHVRQFATLGWWRMCREYGALFVRHGYRDHPLEHEARAAERFAER